MIAKLEINNFRMLKGPTELCFDPMRPITLLMAERCSGSTTVFHAIAWCLYGFRSVRGNTTDLVNIETLERAAENQIIEVSVSCTIIANDTTTVLRRTASFQRLYKGAQFVGETLSVNSIDSPVQFKNIVAQLFPEKYLDYFMWNSDFHRRYRFDSLSSTKQENWKEYFQMMR